MLYLHLKVALFLWYEKKNTHTQPIYSIYMRALNKIKPEHPQTLNKPIEIVILRESQMCFSVCRFSVRLESRVGMLFEFIGANKIECPHKKDSTRLTKSTKKCDRSAFHSTASASSVVIWFVSFFFEQTEIHIQNRSCT